MIGMHFMGNGGVEYAFWMPQCTLECSDLHSVGDIEVRSACWRACKHRAYAVRGQATGKVAINGVIGCCSRVSVHRTWDHTQKNTIKTIDDLTVCGQ